MQTVFSDENYHDINGVDLALNLGFYSKLFLKHFKVTSSKIIIRLQTDS